MEKTITTQDVLVEVHKEMARANAELKLSSPDKFNRTVLELIKEEISIGEVEASNWKNLCQGSTEYTYSHKFPSAIFDNLSEDFILQLECSGIYLHKDIARDFAQIRIVFHF